VPRQEDLLRKLYVVLAGKRLGMGLSDVGPDGWTPIEQG
jgi:hypothetical protein